MQIGKLNRSRAILMLCDIQQKFTPHVYAHQAVQQAILLCLKISNVFDLPAIATEHNPKAFGKIIPQILSNLPNNHHISQKITFSMIDQKVEQSLKKYQGRNQVILVGMQTHACILQTFIDLKMRNYEVFLPFDAISSIRPSDRTYAIQRLISQGGIPTSVESLAFQLLGDYKDPHFKKVSALLKEGGARSNAIAHL